MATAAIHPARTTGLTYADLDHIPQEREGDRHELFDGELVVTPSPIPFHEIVTGNFAFSLETVVRPRRLGWVFTAPVDVRFTEKAVAIPDVGFVRRERLSIVGPASINGVPDLVAEVLSPSTRHRDLNQKKALYARFGVPEYWIFDPNPREVTLLLFDGGQYRGAPQRTGSVRSTVVDGFTAEVPDFFAMP